MAKKAPPTPDKPPRKPAKRKPVASVKAAPPDDPVIEGPLGDFIPVTMLVKYSDFVRLYLETGDSIGSAKKAMLMPDDIAPQSARATVRGILHNPHVVEMLTTQYKAILAKTGATVERVWEEIAYAAFLDPAVFYDGEGNVKPMTEIPEAARRAITGMKVKTGTIGEDGEFTERELKHGGKDAALEKLMRLHRMVDQDKLVVVDGDEWMRKINEGQKRAADAARGVRQ